jgi:hypothetical protein
MQAKGQRLDTAIITITTQQQKKYFTTSTAQRSVYHGRGTSLDGVGCIQLEREAAAEERGSTAPTPLCAPWDTARRHLSYTTTSREVQHSGRLATFPCCNLLLKTWDGFWVQAGNFIVTGWQTRSMSLTAEQDGIASRLVGFSFVSSTSLFLLYDIVIIFFSPKRICPYPNFYTCPSWGPLFESLFYCSLFDLWSKRTKIGNVSRRQKHVISFFFCEFLTNFVTEGGRGRLEHQDWENCQARFGGGLLVFKFFFCVLVALLFISPGLDLFVLARVREPWRQVYMRD